jgi:hypothetical protein
MTCDGPFTAANTHLDELADAIRLALTPDEARTCALGAVKQLSNEIRQGYIEGALIEEKIEGALEALAGLDEDAINQIMGQVSCGLTDAAIQAPPLAPDRNANGHGCDTAMPLLLSLRDFLKDFVPPDYLVEGMLQRRFIYALTGQTGHAKTALALLIAILVGEHKADAMLGNHAVEPGQVVYFAGENPDDVRMRLIGIGVDLDAHISVIPGVFNIDEMFTHLAAEMQRLDKIDLIIIDTSAAYFLGQDENANPQMGSHARLLRRLTTMPGGPCVLVLCHPIKYVAEPAQLLPRGGGAFLAEMDGNLTAWLRDDLVELHHNKIRGPGFEPLTFKIERITSTKLVDSKGRLLPTVKAVPVTEQEEARQKQGARKEEDQLLAAITNAPFASLADLARICGWTWGSGEPAKSRVERVLGRLKHDKFVNPVRGHWELTAKGEKAAQATDGAKSEPKTAAAPFRAVANPFRAIKGKRLDDVPCCQCHQFASPSGEREVYKIRDGRIKGGPGSKAEALHEGCAAAWFNPPAPPKPAPRRALATFEDDPNWPQ